MQIEVTTVQKSFGQAVVLQDLSIKAKAGAILGLLGPSGAGKTTLIRLLNGSLRPDHGTIKVEGDAFPNRTAQRQIGYMPQHDAVYLDLSGIDNLLFFGHIYGLKTKYMRRRIGEVLEFVGLQHDATKIVGNYSGGMRKRLSLAIALLHEPAILLLDEPTVGIDPVLRQAIWQHFDELRNQGKTLIVSTHVMDEATRCQDVALLYNGKLIEHDTVPNLLAKTPDGQMESLFFMAKAGELQ
ncbi:MAG: ABC transporter ATP-binding protein [Eubacteriales bacterium]|nr:ABC transporter ATP-binding protein [Eubacteriales bacterium]